MKKVTMIITNPSSDCSNSMNISWHSSLDFNDNYLLYHKKYSKNWIKVYPKSHYVDVFDKVYTISKKRRDFYQDVKFNHHEVTLEGLDADTYYSYKINGTNTLYSFKTAPKNDFSFIWFSDFHTYPPCPNRLIRAQKLVTDMDQKHPKTDFLFCSGDAIAWGGSYKFWEDFYKMKELKKYMIANVLGNHDFMSRGYLKDTALYFKEVNNFPKNSYEGEYGISYYFKYANVLFIVFHNEHMGVGSGEKKEEIEKAYAFLEKTIKENPSEYIFLCQHYQWMNGVNGKDTSFGYLRWKDLCDKYHIDLALAANDHTYMRSYPIYKGEINKDGTVYMQCPSCDGERGQEIEEVLTTPNPKIAKRYATGANTIGGIYVKIKGSKVQTILYDKDLNIIDTCEIEKKMRKTIDALPQI